jgi:hypothetical protein
MLKLTILAALIAGACTMAPSTTKSSATPYWEGCEPDDTCNPPPTGPTCETKKDGVVDLDSQPANLDHSDGKVTYCHATGSESNPYILITTSTEGCTEGHEGHDPGGNDDIFPTQGCAD